MQLIPDVGKVRLLTDLIDQTGNWGDLRLFVNDVTPSESDTSSTFTEASFAGYAAGTVVRDIASPGWSTPTALELGRVQSKHSVISFSNTSGSSQTVYGSYVTSGATLLWAERFANPETVANGASLSLTLTLEAISQSYQWSEIGQGGKRVGVLLGMFGQSEMVGRSDDSAITTTAHGSGDVLYFSTDGTVKRRRLIYDRASSSSELNRSINPLDMADTTDATEGETTVGSNNFGETIFRNGAGTMRDALTRDRVLGLNVARGAAQINGDFASDLKKGSIHFANLIQAYERGRQIMEAAGLEAQAPVLWWFQGAGDVAAATPKDDYKSDLATLREDVQEYVRMMLRSQHQEIEQIWMMHQFSHGNYQSDRDESEDIINANFEMAWEYDDGRFKVYSPVFDKPWDDNIHWSATATQFFGGRHGSATLRHIQGENIKAVRPKSISVSGAVATFEYEGHETPLVKETTDVTDPGDNGFEILDGATPLTISSVAISGDDVDVTCTTTIPANATIRCGLNATSTNGGPTTGSRNNIRETSTKTDEAGNTLHRYSLLYEVQLTGGTWTPPAVVARPSRPTYTHSNTAEQQALVQRELCYWWDSELWDSTNEVYPCRGKTGRNSHTVPASERPTDTDVNGITVASFNGSDESIRLPDFFPLASWCIFALIKIPHSASDQTFLGSGIQATGVQRSFRWFANQTRVKAWINNQSALGGDFVTINNDWVVLTYRFNSYTRIATQFFNSKTTSSSSNDLARVNFDNTMRIGGYQTNGNEPFSGEAKEILFYANPLDSGAGNAPLMTLTTI